jgi:hypothetical protein
METVDAVGAGRILRGPRGSATYQPSAGSSSRRVGFTTRTNERDRKRVRAELDKQEKFLKDNLSGFKGDAPIFMESYKPPLNIMLQGYYNTRSHEISLGKGARRGLGKGKRGRVAEHTAIHEQVHSRSGLNRKGQTSTMRESSTELISRRLTHKMYGQYPRHFYAGPTSQLGNYAMQRSNGNVRSAWRYTNSVHRGTTTPPRWIYSDFRLKYSNDWVKMVEYKGDVRLEEEADEMIELQQDDIEGDATATLKDRLEMYAYELMDQGKWAEAMTAALRHGDEGLVMSIAEAAAHEGIFFTDGKSVSDERGSA